MGVNIPSISIQQIEAVLNGLGTTQDYIFVLPVGSERGLIGFWHPEVGARHLILEDDALATASYQYLLRRGARRFDTDEEMLRAIAIEKWPGWDTCADAVRERNLRSDY